MTEKVVITGISKERPKVPSSTMRTSDENEYMDYLVFTSNPFLFKTYTGAKASTVFGETPTDFSKYQPKSAEEETQEFSEQKGQEKKQGSKQEQGEVQEHCDDKAQKASEKIIDLQNCLWNALYLLSGNSELLLYGEWQEFLGVLEDGIADSYFLILQTSEYIVLHNEFIWNRNTAGCLRFRFMKDECAKQEQLQSMLANITGVKVEQTDDGSEVLIDLSLANYVVNIESALSVINVAAMQEIMSQIAISNQKMLATSFAFATMNLATQLDRKWLALEVMFPVWNPQSLSAVVISYKAEAPSCEGLNELLFGNSSTMFKRKLSTSLAAKTSKLRMERLSKLFDGLTKKNIYSEAFLAQFLHMMGEMIPMPGFDSNNLDNTIKIVVKEHTKNIMQLYALRYIMREASYIPAAFSTELSGKGLSVKISKGVS